MSYDGVDPMDYMVDGGDVADSMDGIDEEYHIADDANLDEYDLVSHISGIYVPFPAFFLLFSVTLSTFAGAFYVVLRTSSNSSSCNSSSMMKAYLCVYAFNYSWCDYQVCIVVIGSNLFN